VQILIYYIFRDHVAFNFQWNSHYCKQVLQAGYLFIDKKKVTRNSYIAHNTSSSGTELFSDTFGGAPSGTLTQFRKPASSKDSLSISPSTLNEQTSYRLKNSAK
jgi:hypothetical protein